MDTFVLHCTMRNLHRALWEVFELEVNLKRRHPLHPRKHSRRRQLDRMVVLSGLRPLILQSGAGSEFLQSSNSAGQQAGGVSEIARQCRAGLWRELNKGSSGVERIIAAHE